MSRVERSEKVFASEEEARSFATKWEKDMWAYDGFASVYQRDGQWVVALSSRDSCD